MKRIITIAALLSAAFMSFGQQMLPNDPAVKVGKLDNGMTYYIRHNDKPAQRAEFYLATNVGAIQETPDQDGLAHFLEHMCFNGLKNLPGKQMLDYLQHIGAEFGRNINASTGVEHTQYMLNNMPVTREGILDTCLLVMHDYSHFVLNDPAEIDAERGVILEEKRTRNTASWRMFEKSAPYFYGPDSKYAHCNIIGSEENLKTFQPSSLKNFYETWYRPDMQAIIVVGDIDVDQVYSKIVNLFADIPAPEQPTVKVMPEVLMNDEPVVGILTDPENTSTSVEFIWKAGKPLPKQLNGTDVGFVQRLVRSFISAVMSERFNDIASKSDAPFLGASFGMQNLCETCAAFAGSVACENSKTLEACKAFLVEVEKMRRFGFTDDEVNRVKERIIKSYKDAVAAADTRKNADFVMPIMNNFFSGYPYMTPEVSLQMVEAVCAQLNAAAINQIIPQMFKAEHLTILYEGVDQPGQVHPEESQLLALVEEVKAADIKANEVETISRDFIGGRKIKAGKVKKEAKGMYGSTVWMLSNGLKVVVLPTEYKKDQVMIDIRKKGGLSLVPTEALPSFDDNIMSLFNSNSGIAEFPNTTVSKMLSGKTVRVGSYINSMNSGVSGFCTPEDVETALQLAYLQFVAPRFDQDEWNTGINQINAVLPNMLGTPDFVFQSHLLKALYDSPRRTLISKETVEQASLDVYAKYYRQLFADVAGATMYIVGNVDLNTLKPLVEKYCGSLPKGKKAAGWNLENIPEIVKGSVSDVYSTKMNTPKATVLQVYSADVPYTLQKSVDLDAANFVLDMIYVSTLREEEGGTYGASASMGISFQPSERATFQVYFDTNIQQQEALRALAVKGLKGLAENGPDAEQLTRAIENARKNIPEKRINNSYWMSALRYNESRGGDYDAEYEQAVSNISAEGIKAVLQEVLSQGNMIEVVQLPE